MEEVQREDAMRAYWKSLDTCFFPKDLPEDTLELFKEQFNVVNNELDDPVPTIKMFTYTMISVIA